MAKNLEESLSGGERLRSRGPWWRLAPSKRRCSLVLVAAGNDSRVVREALSSLCQTYWYPLYAYLRRRGLDPEDARDLTQGFLTSLYPAARTSRGYVRIGPIPAVSLASLKHYLSNWSAREWMQKRGGGGDGPAPERRGPWTVVEPLNHATPKRSSAGAGHSTVSSMAVHLRVQWTAQGRASEFDELKECLLGQATAGGYAAVAARPRGCRRARVKAAVHRLRRRFHSRRASASRKPLWMAGMSMMIFVISSRC